MIDYKGFTVVRIVPLFVVSTMAVIGIHAAACTAPRDEGSERWYKGNLHTHSLWSDGDQFPEVIGSWYRDNGYSFLAISDHNTIADGAKWVDVSGNPRNALAFAELTASFGRDYPSTVDSAGSTFARLSTFDEYRSRLEQQNEFLLIRAEEVTDRFGSLPIHINVSNIQELIEPQGGTSVRETIQRNLDAIDKQREETGSLIVPHINHPNFGWGISADDLAFITGDKFFEVYNGHPLVMNEGDSTHASTERIWDSVLAARLERGLQLMYGIATDDAHNFLSEGLAFSNPGRGWVSVHARSLDADEILTSLEAGSFYASSGVTIEDIRFVDGVYSFSIVGQGSHQTEFIASFRDPASTTALRTDGVGVVVATDTSRSPQYRVQGNELYVRATVTSSRLKSNPYRSGEFERAWIQPVVPR